MSESKQRRSPEQRLADLDKKMEQLKAQRQRVQAQVSQKERKERTRRLIQVGAIFEKQYPDMAEMELDQVNEFARTTRRLSQVAAIIEKRFPKMAALNLDQINELADMFAKLVKEEKQRQATDQTVTQSR